MINTLLQTFRAIYMEAASTNKTKVGRYMSIGVEVMSHEATFKEKTDRKSQGW